MNREEYLKEVTIGGISLHNREIELAEYDENWPGLYQKEARKIYKYLDEKILLLEHVGSTSVPGLCAKPILDILLIVEDSSDEASYAESLEKAGYLFRIREPEWFGHRMFKGLNPAVNLHVFSRDCEEAARMLAFRDWLRTNIEDRSLYAETKRQLARQPWKYVQDYADAKTQVIREIMERALR